MYSVSAHGITFAFNKEKKKKKISVAARGYASCLSRLKGMLARDGFAVPDACHDFS